MLALKIAIGACVIATAAVCTLVDASRGRTVIAGFWFEPVTFTSPLLGPLTATDMASIETVARAEVVKAFDGLNIEITDRRDARYHVRVVDHVRFHGTRRTTWVAGSAHAMAGFGGAGSVSFVYYASGALVYAPPEATRPELIEAIGRGIGRGAVHEFAHQLLPSGSVQHSRDRGSYEYYAASRPEQYFGPMHWDFAGPLLKKRFSGTTRR